MATKPKAKKSTTSTLAEKASFMPVSFKEFSKNPVIGTLFIALCGIGYLYIDGRNMNTEIISAQNKKISVLEVKIDRLTDRVRLSDSMMSSAQSKIKTLQELGKIK